MGPIEGAIRSSASPGLTLSTPTGRGQFSVAQIDERGIVLLLGKKEWPTPLTWACLEGIADFLSDREWTPIGSRYETSGEPGTLDGYLKGCLKRTTAGWVAVLLEHAGVVEIDRSRPARVHLRPDWAPPS
ncbi:MAG: hypothetical protein GY788_07960 [bacterium]|nr:hypothetical protein [bacterium]